MFDTVFARTLLCALCLGGLARPGGVDASTEYRHLLPESLSSSVIDEKYDWSARVDAAKSMATLGEGAFGDSTSFYDGATSFSVTDLDLPGNDGLPVRITRTHSASDPQGMPTSGILGEWDLDLPHVRGNFARSLGWQVESSEGGQSGSNARCSTKYGLRNAPSAIAQIGGGAFPGSAYWSGNTLSVPGAGDQLLLVPGPGNSNIASGGSVRWTTRDYWQIRCLPTLLNGTGEGFQAVSPDGTTYTFNYEVRRPLKSLSRADQIGTTTILSVLDRDEVRLYATRVEDRFGNWVNYHFVGSQLRSISAKDGRHVDLSYYGSGAATGLLQSVSTGSGADLRRWVYSYSTSDRRLISVELPDSSRWTLQTVWLELRYVTPAGFPSCTLAGWAAGVDEKLYTFTHPSGASAAFVFAPVRHERGSIPQKFGCRQEKGRLEQGVARQFDTYALARKTISGPGLTPMQWQLVFSQQGFGQAQKFVTLHGPDGSREEMRFGTRYYSDEGKLLVQSTYGSENTLLRETFSTYAINPTSPAYAYRVGTGPITETPDDFASSFQTPLTSVSTTQQSTSFTRSITQFDAFARVRVESQSSSLGHARTIDQTYLDDTARWVIGLPRRTTINGVVSEETTYHTATSLLPHQHYSFGQLTASTTWAADGTLRTVVDGNHYTTELLDFRRGLPQLIRYPDGRARSAVVDTHGWVRSISDELGHTTAFGYDLLGRITRITPPTDSTQTWAPTTISYTREVSAAFGIPAQHWVRDESRGNYRKQTRYDGLWQPLVEHEYDIANPSLTQRYLSWRYDHAGRVTFAAYPLEAASSLSSFAHGTYSDFDAIGRPISVSASTEGGFDTTSYAYLSGFRTQVTNARGFVTTSHYQAFDSPDTGGPTRIDQPEGVTTDISRDVFGKPLSVVRRGVYNGLPQSLSRSFIYDSHQRLCKRIEPEAGVTVMDYDGANNLLWSADGQSLTGATCDRQSVSFADRTWRGYDARHRLTSVTYPGDTVDTYFEYEADGALKRAYTSQWNPADPASFADWRYTYNARRLLKSETNIMGSGSNGKSKRYDYGYDPLGHLASVSFPDGHGIDHAPNALGQPTRAGSFATGAQYFPDGSLKQVTYGNGITRTQTRFAVRPLIQRTQDTFGGTVYHDFQYAVDPVGNVQSITDLGGTGVQTRQMTYDGLDRLTNVHAPSQYGFARYAYDPLDNLREADQGGRQHRYSYLDERLSTIRTAAGQDVWSFGFDARGNLTTRSSASQPGVPAQTQTYRFDRANRLLGLSGPVSADYYYDAHGRRAVEIRPGFAQYTLYTRDGTLRGSFDSAGTFTTHIHLGKTLVASRRAANSGAITTTWHHTDQLGSPVAETTASPTLENTIRTHYAPYGEPLNRAVTGPGYTGHQMDENSGLIYMQQRYYDPVVGRFLSVDPVAADANTGGNFNRYWYANNNPYTNFDPDGRACNSLSGGGCGQNTLGQTTVEPSTGAAVAWGVVGVAGVAAIAGPAIAGAAMVNMPRAVAAVNATAEIVAGDALGTSTIVAAATAMKLSGAGHEMFQAARNLIVKSDAPAAAKVDAFDAVSARIGEATGGAWSAAKSAGADGSTIYSGGRGNMMVIDPAGNVFSGKVTAESLPASQIPNYDKLERLQ